MMTTKMKEMSIEELYEAITKYDPGKPFLHFCLMQGEPRVNEDGESVCKIGVQAFSITGVKEKDMKKIEELYNSEGFIKFELPTKSVYDYEPMQINKLIPTHRYTLELYIVDILNKSDKYEITKLIPGNVEVYKNAQLVYDEHYIIHKNRYTGFEEGQTIVDFYDLVKETL